MYNNHIFVRFYKLVQIEVEFIFFIFSLKPTHDGKVLLPDDYINYDYYIIGELGFQEYKKYGEKSTSKLIFNSSFILNFNIL